MAHYPTVDELILVGVGADPVLVPGDLYHYSAQPPYPAQPTNGYSAPPGYPGYDGPGGEPGRYHPDGRLGGHCNHLKDDCECFKDDYTLPRKVRIFRSGAPL